MGFIPNYAEVFNLPQGLDHLGPSQTPFELALEIPQRKRGRSVSPITQHLVQSLRTGVAKPPLPHYLHVVVIT